MERGREGRGGTVGGGVGGERRFREVRKERGGERERDTAKQRETGVTQKRC